MLFIIDKYPNEYYEFLRKMPKNYSKCEIVSEGIISTTATVDFTRGLETDVRTFTDFLSDIPESDMRKFQNGNNDNKQFNSILIHNQKTFLKSQNEIRIFSFSKTKNTCTTNIEYAFKKTQQTKRKQRSKIYKTEQSFQNGNNSGEYQLKLKIC